MNITTDTDYTDTISIADTISASTTTPAIGMTQNPH
jgi:hypothetical protein